MEMKKYFYISNKYLLIALTAFLLLSCSNSESDKAEKSNSNKVEIAQNGLPSVKYLIDKPEIKKLLKQKSFTKEDTSLLIGILTGYDFGLIRMAVNLLDDENINMGALGVNEKIFTKTFSNISYSQVVTATAAALLINGHPIIEAGDTSKGCVIKSKITYSLSSLSGGLMTVWVEPDEGVVNIYIKSQLNQPYDLFDANDNGIQKVISSIETALGRHPSFGEAHIRNQ